MANRTNGTGGAGAASREPPNVVHQNAIMAETIKKQQLNQKTYTNLADKPNRTVPAQFSQDENTDEFLKESLTKGKRVPKQKYNMPLTSSQEYGWDIADDDLQKPPEVLYRPKQSCELTRFMGEYWRQKEQEKLSGQQQVQQTAGKK
eukprot:gene5039-130_t